jgi:hypothetical protein
MSCKVQEVYAFDFKIKVLFYHFSMISSDDLGDTQSHDEAAIPKDGLTAGKEKKRSRNFSVDEDNLLVSGWLNVSTDPIHGTDQALGTYWARIHKYFHANKNFESDRSQGSLMNSWSAIQHDVNVFCGCISKTEARNQSGCSIDDKVCEHSLFYSSFVAYCFLLCRS